MLRRGQSALRELRRDESGLTLAEMLVTVLLISGVLLGAATILQNTVRGYVLVESETSASTQAQTAARAFTAGVRNAAHLQVSPETATVRAQHATTGQCMAWTFRNGNLYGRVGGGEHLLVSGVDVEESFFSSAEGTGTATAAGATLHLRVHANRADPVEFTTTAFPRYQSEESNTCWSA